MLTAVTNGIKYFTPNLVSPAGAVDQTHSRGIKTTNLHSGSNPRESVVCVAM